jgi:putative transposase
MLNCTQSFKQKQTARAGILFLFLFLFLILFLFSVRQIPMRDYTFPSAPRAESLPKVWPLHFITFSCYRRRPLLAAPTARTVFEQALERTRRKYGFLVCGYVVLPEPFWTERYCDFNVFSTSKTIEKFRYMHNNPVKRGLVMVPEDWQWSSFRHYLYGEVGNVEIESVWTDRKRGRTGSDVLTVKVKDSALAKNRLEQGTLREVDD